jgi:tetratricopeptide (TPR) repeat protein
LATCSSTGSRSRIDEIFLSWNRMKGSSRIAICLSGLLMKYGDPALCRATEIRGALPYVAACLGSGYLWSGRAPDAVALLEEAVDALAAMRALGLGSWLITFLAEAYLVSGRVAEAREGAEQAVAVARGHREPGWEAWALKLLGNVHAHKAGEDAEGAVERAADAYRQALALATELGMRPLVAHCHFGLGKLRAETGEHEGGERASRHCDGAVPRHGHAVLAGAGRGSTGLTELAARRSAAQKDATPVGE